MFRRLASAIEPCEAELLDRLQAVQAIADARQLRLVAQGDIGSWVAREIQNVTRCDKSVEGVCGAESETMCMSNEACLNWRVLEMNLMQRKSPALTQARCAAGKRQRVSRCFWKFRFREKTPRLGATITNRLATIPEKLQCKLLNLRCTYNLHICTMTITYSNLFNVHIQRAPCAPSPNVLEDFDFEVSQESSRLNADCASTWSVNEMPGPRLPRLPRLHVACCQRSVYFYF